MEADRFMRERVLGMVPQQHPFRFIEDILELDEEHIVGVYRFQKNEYFYRGHFPGLPITPGVILIETMAQTGVVAFGLYLAMLAGKGKKGDRGQRHPVHPGGKCGVHRRGQSRRARHDYGQEDLFPRKSDQGRCLHDAAERRGGLLRRPGRKRGPAGGIRKKARTATGKR